MVQVVSSEKPIYMQLMATISRLVFHLSSCGPEVNVP